MAAEFCRTCLLCVLCALPVSLALAGDPTMPPGWTRQAEPEQPQSAAVPLILQQILIRGDHAVAVINNQLVRTGDYVDGAKILAISATSVRVKVRRQERELSLLTDTRTISE